MLVDALLWLLFTFMLFITIFLLLIFLEHGRIRQDIDWPADWPTVSLIVPAYNEEETLAMTLDSLQAASYPDDQKEIIVVNDGSTDDTEQIAEQYTDDSVTLINQQNQGKGGALNTGLEEATGTFVGCVDADSTVEEDAIKNIVAAFDEDTAAIASAMKVKDPGNLLQRLQWIEYISGIWLRRIMSWINSITVAPGPLSIYRREVLEDLDGFDEDSIVEDMEIAFRLQHNHWKIGHSRLGEVHTVAPATLHDFYRQRYRWYKGSLNNIVRYRDMLFNREYGDFGMYTLPSQLGQGLLSVLGLFLFAFYLLEPLYTAGTTAVKQAMALGVASLWPEPNLGQLTGQLYWSLLGRNFTTVTMILALFAVSGAMTYLACRHTDENLFEHGYLPPFLFLTYYFIMIGTIWCKILLEIVTGTREVRWWR